MDYYNQSYPF